MKKQTTHITIKGMTCTSCETLIREELLTVAGVTGVQVHLKTRDAVIESTGHVSGKEILAAVERAGYTAVIAA